MPLTVEAIYENGVLKPTGPLPLKEHEKVRVTIEAADNWVQRTAGIIPCADPHLIEWAAMDPELDYPPPHVERDPRDAAARVALGEVRRGQCQAAARGHRVGIGRERADLRLRRQVTGHQEVLFVARFVRPFQSALRIVR
jgi:predicted DNA-binding antitoxin AbrB/MazE fold protein